MLAFLNSGQSSTLTSPDAVNSRRLRQWHWRMRRMPIRRHARYCTMVSILLLVLTWIVGGIQIFEAQRTNGRYLSHVLTGFRPVEVGRIAGQDDHATGRIRLHLVAVELIAQADVENAGHDRVHSVLRVSVWHQLHAGGHFDPDHVGAGL